MSEEQKVDTPEEGEQQEQSQEQTTNPVEEAARAQGWVPKEEWDGDPTKWRDATTYLDRGELLTKIKSQSTEMRELRGMLGHLSEQNRRLYEAGYEKAIADLEAQRDRAIEEGQTASVRQLDKAIRDHEKELDKVRNATPAVDPAAIKARAEEQFENFRNNNKWYEENEVMQDWANGAAVKFKARNPSATDGDIYDYLSREVKTKFPEKFQRKVGAPSPDGKGARSPQQGGARGSASEFEALLAELPEAEAEVARNLVKRGYITKEKYMQDLKAIGGWR